MILTVDSVSGFTRTDDEFIEAASGALRSVLEKLADIQVEVEMRLKFLFMLILLSLQSTIEGTDNLTEKVPN